MLNLKLIFVIGAILAIVGTFGYLKYKNSSLGSEIENKKQEIVKVENDKKIETFEERWRTIAEERNSSNRLEEVKTDEDIKNIDGNGSFIITF